MGSSADQKWVEFQDARQLANARFTASGSRIFVVGLIRFHSAPVK